MFPVDFLVCAFRPCLFAEISAPLPGFESFANLRMRYIVMHARTTETESTLSFGKRLV